MEIFLILIITAFIVLSLWRLDFGVITIAGLLPFYLFRFEIGGIPFTLLEVFIVTIAVIFFFRQKLYRLTYLKDVFEKVPFKIPLLLFFLAATFSVFVSNDTLSALGYWRAYFLEAIIYYVVFVNVINTPAKYRKILYLLGVSTLVLSVYAIWQNFTGFGIPQPWNEASLRRVTAWFPYPVALSLFVAPVVGLFFGQLLFYKKKLAVKWYFSIAVIVLGSLAVYYTHSRGAILAIIFTLAVLGIFPLGKSVLDKKAGSKFKYRYLIIFIVLAALILLFTVPGVSDRFISVFKGEDNSTNVRLVLWQGTWRLIQNNWFFGAGLAGFPKLYDVYREARHTELLLYPHNIILNFWVEIGIIGLVSFAWLTILFFRKAWQGLKNKTKPLFIFTPVAAMSILLIHGLVDVPYFKNDLAVLFWIIMGLLVVSLDKNFESKSNNSVQYRLTKVKK